MGCSLIESLMHKTAWIRQAGLNKWAIKQNDSEKKCMYSIIQPIWKGFSMHREPKHSTIFFLIDLTWDRIFWWASIYIYIWHPTEQNENPHRCVMARRKLQHPEPKDVWNTVCSWTLHCTVRKGQTTATSEGLKQLQLWVNVSWWKMPNHKREITENRRYVLRATTAAVEFQQCAVVLITLYFPWGQIQCPETSKKTPQRNLWIILYLKWSQKFFLPQVTKTISSLQNYWMRSNLTSIWQNVIEIFLNRRIFTWCCLLD